MVIYKKDTAGKIRFLSIEALNGTVVQTSGVWGSVNGVTHISHCEAKNVGKANATTPEEQAKIEAQAKYTEKLRLGYFNTVEEARNLGGNSFLLPMLAKDFKKEEKKVRYPCYAQPKLDGMRTFGEKSVFMSRTGKAVETINHIDFEHIEEILDGELYAHGRTFQEVMRMVKKLRPETSEIVFHVYDVVMDAPYRERREWLNNRIKLIPNVELVETVVINSKEELINYHKLNLERGYEGTMIRHSEESYTCNKRSGQLLKYKDFLDEVYTVVDVVPSESRPTHGVIHCQGVDNTGHSFTFGCGMKFSHKQREEILLNKEQYIGQRAEIRFFEFTELGIPRFPVCVGFRVDK